MSDAHAAVSEKVTLSGKSPRVRPWIFRPAVGPARWYDIIHTLAAVAVGLTLFARTGQAESAEPLPWSIVDAVAADPLEAACAAAGFFVTMYAMGNSPVAWLLATFFFSVDVRMWAEFLAYVTATCGSTLAGITMCGFAAFAGTYIVHGLMMLPLDLWATPDAFDQLVISKVQPDKRLAGSALPKVFRNILFNLVTIALPLVFVTVKGSLASDSLLRIDSTLPSHKERFFCMLCCIAGNEICFFYSHWALHSKRLYAMIHKRHHEFTSPFALAAIYCHPVEFLLGDIVPLGIGLMLTHAHAFFALQWIVLAVVATQVHHSGFRLPWHFEPDEQPDFHDFHHMRFNCNYGHMGILDKLHGTSEVYERYIAKRALEAQERKDGQTRTVRDGKGSLVGG